MSVAINFKNFDINMEIQFENHNYIGAAEDRNEF